MKKFLPLIVIVALILAATGLMVFRMGEFELMFAMRNFMGFFFLFFSLPKLMNWKGFAEAFAMYDLIAMRSKPYACLYPLIELSLAAGFLTGSYLLEALWITLVLMLVGSLGVFQKVRRKEKIQCACMGVVFKLPMTWVTLGEDLLMAVMAAVMIFMLN